MSTVDEQLPPPPQPPLPHPISSSCPRHPHLHPFTGFCPSCLRDRLSLLHPSSSSAVPASKPAPSALKSVCRSSLPELRRTQSFSVGKNDSGLGFGGVYEPQRKSCDVRGRNTLWSLFSQDDGNRAANCALDAVEDRLEGKISSCNGFVIELEEEVGDQQEAEVEEVEEANPRFPSEEVLEAEKMDLKEMRRIADLEKKGGGGGKEKEFFGGGFWKKVKAWTRKSSKRKKEVEKKKKKSNGGRGFRETQSEVADYGNGRRSCDIDPRFSVDAGRMSLDYGRISLDAGRMSFDDPRYSFDEPRASWDGYLIGGGRLNGLSRLGVAPMGKVVEERATEAMALRKDNVIQLEEPRRSIHEEEGVPGGAEETKEYYLDSSSRRRKSLDRSSSAARRISAAVVVEMDEMKQEAGVCNAKVTPAASIGSLRDDCCEGFRDSGSVIGSSSDRKVVKKSRSWKSWNIWGLIGRRGGSKDEDDDRCSREDGSGRLYSESCQDMGRGGFGVNPRDAFSRNGFRSNSSVSWRSSHSHSLKKSVVETNGHAKKPSNEFVLERNRSARYSANHVESGQLRFYTSTMPMRGSRRGPTVKAKEAAYSRTMAGSMLY